MRPEDLKTARVAGAPILAAETADQHALLETIIRTIGDNSPAIVWDCVSGLRHGNARGRDVLVDMTVQNETAPAFAARTRAFPGMMIAVLDKTSAHKGLVVVALNAHRLEDPSSIQAIFNCREPFKTSKRTLILLGPAFVFPAELANDVIVYREPLPSDARLQEIVRDTFASASQPKPDETEVRRAVPAIRGLSVFGAEQVCALSIRKTGLDHSSLWERKVMAVNQTAGLTLTINDTPKLDDIGGLTVARDMISKMFRGSRPPAAIVRIDEIEKSMAGAAGGDNTGVSQDALQQLLVWMQDNGHTGMIAAGPAGAGKTMFSRAIGATFNVPTIEVDLGAMKHKHVGESERKVREALRVVQGLAGDGGRLFVIGTCNRLDTVPPELRRRFRNGVWMFDLPDASERAAIWKVVLAKFPLATGERPEDEGWTGAEIFTCAELSSDLGVSLREASEYIVPVSKSASEDLERLRSYAEGRFNDASHSGRYSYRNRATGEGAALAVGGGGKRKVGGN